MNKSILTNLSKEYIDWYINLLSTDEKREFANQILREINDNFRGVATKYLETYVNYLNAMKQGANAFDTLIGCNNYITRNSLKYKVAF